MKFVVFKSIYKFCTTKQLFKYLRQRYSKTQIEYLNELVKLKGKIRTLKWNKVFLDITSFPSQFAAA